MNEKMVGNQKIKKLPVVRYLCYLLVVSILFTGVTFSRYVGSTSGDATALLSRFVCSYEIGDMSSVIFANADYWVTGTSGNVISMNTPRSVRFTVRNHTLNADGGADRISDVDLESTLRFYAPAEFAGNLALQIAEVDEGGAYVTRTPQYVIRDFIYGPSIEGEQITSFKTWKEGAILNTTSTAMGGYGARTDIADETLQMSGGFSGDAALHTGTISAYCADTGNSLTITATMQEADYSVGFRRYGKTESEGATMLYLDCRKEVPFYTIDIQLPEMRFDAGEAQERTFVLFLTTVERTFDSSVVGSTDQATEWTQEMNGLLVPPQNKDDQKMFDGALVTGYHFDQEAQVFSWENGTYTATGEHTTVRIQKTYDYENGGAVMSYSHVAPLSEGAASVVHPIVDFYDGQNTVQEDPDHSSITNVHDYHGKCANGGASGYISFADLPDSPLYKTYTAQSADADGTQKQLTVKELLSKGYSSRLNVLFVQASQSAEEGMP